MSSRALRLLLVSLAVLVAAWGAVTMAPRAGFGKGKLSPALGAFFGAIADSSAGILLTGPRDTVRLDRLGRRWLANGYRADSGAVARLWKAVAGAGAGPVAVVSTNPSNQLRMGFTPDSVWRVDIGAHAVLVGNTGPRAGTTYVRLPGEDTVRLVESDLRIRVAHSLDDWRDRWMLAVDTSTVSRVAVELEGQRYAITRDRGSWTLSGAGKADTQVVRIILSELAHLHAAGFLVPGDTIARRPRGGAIAAISASGDTVAEVMLGRGPGDRWARVRNDSTLYRFAYYRVERVAPTRPKVLGEK